MRNISINKQNKLACAYVGMGMNVVCVGVRTRGGHPSQVGNRTPAGLAVPNVTLALLSFLQKTDISLLLLVNKYFKFYNWTF